MRILVVTDAWHPQVNGVVRTLEATRRELAALGHTVEVVGSDRFRSVPLPGYPEIRLAVGAWRRLAALAEAFAPEAVHISTEGPLGLAARRWCLGRGRAFTTAYHTRFPEYVRARLPVPLGLSYAALRRFHAPSQAVMVATASLERELAERGFANLRRWSRGVDTGLFRPRADAAALLPFPRPILLYVGRVAVEKNLDAFLGLDAPGTKVVVGGGPQLEEFRRRYPEVRFLGPLEGEELARRYAAADVFVFPSRTDTFGLVLLEALASGLPVAAYPVAGPRDVIGDAPVGALDEDLGRAVRRALGIPRAACRAFAVERYGWRAASEQFLANLCPA